jgi:hypothetical protein
MSAAFVINASVYVGNLVYGMLVRVCASFASITSVLKCKLVLESYTEIVVNNGLQQNAAVLNLVH